MSRRIAHSLVVCLWVGAAIAIWFSVWRGRELQRTAPEVFLGAAPLVGRNFRDGWDWRFGWGLVGAGLIALIVIVAVARGWFERARLRVVVAASSIAAAAFALLLALTDGKDGVLFGAADDNEYLANLSTAPPVGEFVRTFVDRIDDYSVHVRGHPPGFVVLLKSMDAIGLSGPWPAAMLSVFAAAALPVAVLVTVWALAGHVWVRRSAPFLVVAPYALWMVTSADAVFTAIAAWGVALLALGLTQTGRRAYVFGTAAGVLLCTLLFMTYGGAIFMLIPLVLAIAGWVGKRPGTTLTVAGAIVAAIGVTSVWLIAGFWWFDGASATREEYWDGTAQFRIWNYFIVANLAAALIAVGPATFIALTSLRQRAMWVLVGGALLAVAAADLSQLSKGEVERIWLLFYPWIVIAGAALASRHKLVWAGAVGAQAVFAILLQAALVSKW